MQQKSQQQSQQKSQRKSQQPQNFSLEQSYPAMLSEKEFIAACWDRRSHPPGVEKLTSFNQVRFDGFPDDIESCNLLIRAQELWFETNSFSAAEQQHLMDELKTGIHNLRNYINSDDSDDENHFDICKKIRPMRDIGHFAYNCQCYNFFGDTAFYLFSKFSELPSSYQFLAMVKNFLPSVRASLAAADMYLNKQKNIKPARSARPARHQME